MKTNGMFYFHKNDRMVVCFLVAVAAVIIGVIYLIDDKGSTCTKDMNAASTAETGGGNGIYSSAKREDGTFGSGGNKAEPFPFDPNTADVATLQRLGLPAWMVRNICRYREAGGVFRQREDFARVYGLTKKQYETLAPYIRISDDYRPASDFYAPSPSSAAGHRIGSAEGKAYTARDTMLYPIKLRPGEHIDINTADTTQLKKIPGIGSVYARAVVRRREKIGGFYSKDQLAEIDGFPQEAMPYVKISAEKVRKLNLNRLTYAQLRQHPYLNYYQARDIVDYRRLRGPLKSLADLRLLKSFTPADMERLKPYVEF